MAINIYSVASDLKELGWELLSDSYKNLNTPLLMKCPKGHTVETTFSSWRKTHTCETCLAGDATKFKKGIVPIKKENSYRILALDAATKITGYSVYDDGTLVSFGLFKVEDGDYTERINAIKKWLQEKVKEWEPDFVGIENIQLQHQTDRYRGQMNIDMYRKLANLQGVLLDTLYELGLETELAYSSEWRKTCGIDGNDRENKKKVAQEKVEKWYGVRCTQDEADAICIGKHFVMNQKERSWDDFN